MQFSMEVTVQVCFNMKQVLRESLRYELPSSEKRSWADMITGCI